jgi:hypothetical protein
MDSTPSTPDSATEPTDEDDVQGHISFRPNHLVDPDHVRAQGLPLGASSDPVSDGRDSG